MEQITTVGIDLAKNVFSLHGVDGAGCVVLRRTVRRDQLLEVVARLSPCLIGREGQWGNIAPFIRPNVAKYPHPVSIGVFGREEPDNDCD